MLNEIEWNKDAWTMIQEADAERHKIEICCRTEGDMVVEVRIRHWDGNEEKGTCTKNGENALPMPIKAFEKAFNNLELDIH